MRNLSDALGYSNVQIFLDHVQKNLDICASGTCRLASRGRWQLARLAVRHLGEGGSLPDFAARHLTEAGNFRDLPSGIHLFQLHTEFLAKI
jgi:hypothetical protein